MRERWEKEEEQERERRVNWEVYEQGNNRDRGAGLNMKLL